MRELRSIPLLFLCAALGALLLLAYSLAWRVLSEALGFGTIQFGVPVLGRGLAWNGVASLPMLLWQQAHTPPGFFDVLTGFVLGYGSALAWLHRQVDRKIRDRECDRCKGFVAWIAWPAGIWGAMMLWCVVVPGFLALARHQDAREFWLQQFLLTGLLLNPKLWWCAALSRYVDRICDDAPTSTCGHTLRA